MFEDTHYLYLPVVPKKTIIPTTRENGHTCPSVVVCCARSYYVSFGARSRWTVWLQSCEQTTELNVPLARVVYTLRNIDKQCERMHWADTDFARKLWFNDMQMPVFDAMARMGYTVCEMFQIRLLWRYCGWDKVSKLSRKFVIFYM